MSNDNHKTYQLSSNVLLYEQMHSSISNYLNVTGIVLIGTVIQYIALNLAGDVNQTHLHAWALFQFTLCCIWPVLYYRYHNNYGPIKQIWSAWIEKPLSLLSGLGWGLMWVLFIEPDNVVNIFLLNSVVCIVVVGAVISTPLDRSAMNITIAGCLVPIIISAFLGEAGIFFWMVIGTPIFWGMTYAFGIAFNNLYTQALEQREQNRELAQALELQKQQVERASAEKTRFLAAASHDLRQPIQAMHLFEAVLEPMLTDSEQIAVLRKISEANRSLAGLLEGLLDISRLDSGIIQAEPDYFALHDLFESLYFQLDDLAYTKQIELRYVTTHHQVFIDKRLLERVLRNLVVNAIKHLEKPGKVLLGVRRGSGGGLRLEVIDNGVGIPENEQARIFEAFYQLNNPARNREKGLGLGLSIVKRLCLLMDCELTLRSQVGRGCRFSIDLPLSATSVPVETRKVKHDIHSEHNVFENSKNYHVLILEDDATVAQALSLLLKQWGYSSTTANHSQGALAQLTQCPDLILSDYQLTDETGLEAIDVISQHFAVAIPALLITGSTDPKIMQFLLNVPFKVLHKPIEANVLRLAIGKLMQAQAQSSPTNSDPA